MLLHVAQVLSNQIRLRVESPLSARWTLYINYVVENVRHSNSKVFIVTENLLSSTSTYLLDASLSYGGSSYTESFKVFEFGFQYHFRNRKRPKPIRTDKSSET